MPALEKAEDLDHNPDPPSSSELPPRVFYDRAAPYYDEVIMAPFKQRFTDQMEADFLSMLFPRGSRLLDLGSGTGRSMALLQQRSYRVFGVDISAGMLHKALDREVKSSVQGDISHLPFGPGAFDGAFSMHGGLSHLPTMEDKLAAMQQIDRALKRECVLMIDVPSPYREDRRKTYLVEWQVGEERIKLKGYAWYPEQLEEICESLGFPETILLGDYSLNQKFDKGSRRLILVARRH